MFNFNLISIFVFSRHLQELFHQYAEILHASFLP